MRGAPTGDDGAPIGLPEAVEVVRPDDVRGVAAPGVKLPRSWARVWRSVWRVAHSIEVAQIVSRVRPAYQGVKYDIYI